jgi:hypothetical protein
VRACSDLVVAVNHARVASLLRELADAIEAPEVKRKVRRKVKAPETESSPEAQERARRALRKAGVAA